MINELTVLKSIRHCKAIAKRLDEECKSMALASFCAVHFQNGTMGQMETIARCVCKRNLTEQYFQTVVDALNNMPRGLRALLLSVYVKNVSKSELCEKYKVSIASIYRKLALARKQFALNLCAQGAEEEWFAEICQALKSFNQDLKKRSFDEAYDDYCNAIDA